MEEGKVFNESRFSHQLRPAWTPINMALMVLFFATGLWLFGLLMIGYMLYGKEMGLDFSNWGKAKSSVNKAFETPKWGGGAPSGNAAFDDWRAAEMSRLDEERRKLDDAKREFDDYVSELRRARDQEEFNAFKASWASKRQGDGAGSTA